ncbi:MAG: M48 family metalloprotease [Stenomitos rutilans HA7619-LM2]|jgi:Zn-dependent protease with chaperone function|nr:M48 family metalloprotease [Stenomitos rutilans HA7619-LM2]
MLWNRERYETLIQQLETHANRHPAVYRLQVRLLAGLGYAYLFIILAGLIGLLVGLLWLIVSTQNVGRGSIQSIVLLIFLLVIILQSLWIKFPRPNGLKLERSHFPHLFGLIDDLTCKLQVPTIYHVLLTDEFNASVCQVPRLGILGWYESYLILGLPFMQAISPDQFRAVLAHEFGHLSGNHSRFAGWIYRVRESWLNVLDRLQNGGNHGSTWFFKPFFNWYAPFFYAYSFVLARLDEYEADRCAAQQTSPQQAAEALLNIELQSQKLHYYWENVYEQVEHQIEVPAMVYSQLLSHLKTPIESNNYQTWLETAFARKTNLADTHPCLRDRLAALGYPSDFPKRVHLPMPVAITAAEKLLGRQLEQYVTQFDHNWKLASEAPWKQQHVYIQETRQAVKQLMQKSEVTPLTSDEAWELSCYINKLDGSKAALPYFEAVIKLNNSHVAANRVYGTLLLAEGNFTGIQYLEKAAALNPKIAPDCYETIYNQLHEQGKLEEAKAFLLKWKKHSKVAKTIERKQFSISPRDHFKPHGLGEEVVSHLCQQIAQYQQIKEAYLVQKVVKELQDLPTYFLVIWYEFTFSQNLTGEPSIDQVQQKLTNEISFLGGEYFLTIQISSLRGKLRKIPGSNIYKR